MYTFILQLQVILTGQKEDVSDSLLITNASIDNLKLTAVAKDTVNSITEYAITYNDEITNVSNKNKSVKASFLNKNKTKYEVVKVGNTPINWIKTEAQNTLNIDTSIEDYDAVIWVKNSLGVIKYRDLTPFSPLIVDPNGGTWNTFTAPQTYNLKYRATKEISNPTKEGYTFSSWTISGGSRTTLNNATLTMGEKQSTLTAQYTPNKYNVTINLDGGSMTGDLTRQIDCDSSTTINNPEKEGYTFTGWTVSGTKASLSGTSLKVGAEDVTLTANWTVNSYPWIAYHNKQNVSGSGYTLVEVDTEDGTANYNTTVTPSVKTYSGFTSPSTQTITIKTANNRVDYNYGRNKYNLVINANGGTYSKSTTTSLYYEQVETLGSITKAGYNLSSWSKSGSGTLSGNTLKQGIGETTLTANWTAQSYTLTYNANGGSVSPASKSITYNSTYGSLPTPTRSGYEFLGWFTATSGGTQITSSTKITVTSAQTIYAHWKQLTLLKNQILADNAGYNTSRVVSSDTVFEKVAVSQTFYNTLTTSTKPKQATAIVENGLYTENRSGKTEGNLPTYFFRGEVSNNYVSFAGKMWRIVRINEDGTVKLILGGSSSTDGYIDSNTHTFSNTYKSTSDMNYGSSSLKTDLDAWYNSNITGTNASKVADTKFCVDFSVGGTGSDGPFYGSFKRVTGRTVDGTWTSGQPRNPQFKCPNSSDNQLYKVGSLTADELSYAGAMYYDYNSSFYLYQNATTSWWWTISPATFYGDNAYQFIVRSGSSTPGYVDRYSVEDPNGARAVISLKADTTISGGNGTQYNPYVVS